jgi:predicted CXXCH cytochrome family protein
MTALWLADREDPRVEKTAITGTVVITNADNTTKTVTLWPNLKPEPGLELIAADYTSVITITRRLTRSLPLPTIHVPVLSNAGCVGCHQNDLLIAGADNHFHNMLPASYSLWKSGAKLIPPQAIANDSAALQALIARGLAQYNTDLQCSSCHQTHRTTEARQYLDRQEVLPKACVQCHREVGQGPVEVKVAEE